MNLEQKTTRLTLFSKTTLLENSFWSRVPNSNEILKNLTPPQDQGPTMSTELEQGLKKERERLVRHLKARGHIKTPMVEQAMREIPRHLFVPDRLLGSAYADTPLPIGEEQTISAPHMVAIMAEELGLEPGHTLLEVGGGSGYHAAVFAFLVGREGKVVSVERIGSLLVRARERVAGVRNYLLDRRITLGPVEFIHGDGSKGFPGDMKFDRISVACTAQEVPKALLQLLKLGGRMLIPVASGRFLFSQELLSITRTEKGFEKKELGSVAFVPLKPGTC